MNGGAHRMQQQMIISGNGVWTPNGPIDQNGRPIYQPPIGNQMHQGGKLVGIVASTALSLGYTNPHNAHSSSILESLINSPSAYGSATLTG
jgi:hypothetical protein